MKKLLSIVFALLMVAAVALETGCAKAPGASETTGKAVQSGETTDEITEEVTEVSDDLPEMSFKGKEFRVLLQAQSQDDMYTEDHETGEPLHDAVFRRNSLVTDRFDFDLIVEYEDWTTVNGMISRAVKAGSDEYDLCFVHMVSGASLAQSNEVLPFEKLPYVNLEKPWWDKEIRNGFSIRNNLMMVNGDISPVSFSITSCMYFNKKILTSLDLEFPYELVRKGEWTFDKLIEYTKDFTSDGDGDGKIDPDSTKDMFGLSSWYLDVPYSFYYAAGGMLVSKDQDDVPFYDPQLERDANIYSKIYDVIITNNAYYETDVTAARFPNVAKMFADGRAMFLDAKLSTAEELRDMDDEFGILPVPKLTADQDYKSFVNGASSMICVPASVPESNREFVSIVTEALASEAYRTVTPVLKETYLKRKITRDADSADMIDYIVRNRVFDMAYVNMHDGVGSYVRDLLTKGTKDISSKLKSYEKAAKKKVENIVKAFDKSLNN